MTSCAIPVGPVQPAASNVMCEGVSGHVMCHPSTQSDTVTTHLNFAIEKNCLYTLRHSDVEKLHPNPPSISHTLLRKLENGGLLVTTYLLDTILNCIKKAHHQRPPTVTPTVKIKSNLALRFVCCCSLSFSLFTNSPLSAPSLQFYNNLKSQ